jgi:hypothetical protein
MSILLACRNSHSCHSIRSIYGSIAAALSGLFPLLLTRETFSDKIGHWNCVILRDSCKLPDLYFPF